MKRVMWIISMVPVVMTVIAMQILPDLIPAHYNMAGEVDRWGSKYEQFIFPVFVLLFALFWHILITHFEKKAKKTTVDKERAEALSNAKVLKVTAIAMGVMQTIMHGFSIYKAYSLTVADTTLAQIDISSFTNVLLGMLFIVLGNFMPKTKNNYMMGLRTTCSMYNDVTWAKSNRMGGVALILTGIATIIISHDFFFINLI